MVEETSHVKQLSLIHMYLNRVKDHFSALYIYANCTRLFGGIFIYLIINYMCK
jgi:hypothetical protein